MNDLIVRAELTGDDTCTAIGIMAKSSSPVLALCRKLIAAGHDPLTPMDVYRGDVLCLRVHSIGEAVGLQVNSSGRGFKPGTEQRGALPMRPNAKGIAA